MADITMCTDDLCPSRVHCRRHAASGTVPHPTHQSHSSFSRAEEAESCKDFLSHTVQVTAPKKTVSKAEIKRVKAALVAAINKRSPKAKKVPKPEVVCTLKLSQAQASVIEQAMELYCRLHLGQFWIIQEVVFPKQYGWEKRDAVQDACRKIFMPELPDKNSNYGIGSSAVDESARTAWSIQRTLRYCRSWASHGKHPRDGRNWNEQMGVNYDEPNMPAYSEAPPVCTYKGKIEVSWPWK